jgi:outer membrane receptor protein involved in Fe transport
VDQIEVLRGPQGTRFGASALAGAIYLRSAPPPESFELDSEVTLGTDESGSVGVSLGGALNDAGTLAYRVSAHELTNDGFRENTYLGVTDSNRRRERTLRGKLRWQPARTWTFDLTGFYIDADDGYDAFAIDNGLETRSDRPGRDAQETVAGSLRVTGRGSRAFTVVGITSAGDSDGRFGFDADWGNPEFWAPYTYDFVLETQRRRRTLTQEVRFVSTPEGRFGGGRVGWVTGLYVSRMTEDSRTVEDGIYLDPAFPDAPFVLDSSIRRDFEADNFALFGETSIELGDRAELVVGLRGERREADYRDDAGNAFDPGETMVGGQVTWSREVGTTGNVYARIARGYKAGGFNLDLPAEAPDDLRLYDAEYLWNYEAGFKGRLAGGRAAWDLIGFWSDRRDQQVETSIQLDPSNPTSFLFLTDNAGRGTNAGIEASGLWEATRGLRLHGSLGWLRTEIDEFGTNDSLNGRDQPHAPRLSYAAGGTWRGARGAFARVDVTGNSSFYFDTSHDQRSEPYTLVDVRVGIEREAWAAYLWGRNVFDEAYATRGFYFGNEPPDFPNRLYIKRGDPRHVGITVRFVR